MKEEIIYTIKKVVGNREPLAFYLHIEKLLEDYREEIRKGVLIEIEVLQNQEEYRGSIDLEPSLRFFKDL